MSTPNNIDNSKWGVQCREMKADKPIDANAEFDALKAFIDARVKRYSTQGMIPYTDTVKMAVTLEILRKVLTDPDAAKRFRKEIFGE